jgi:hypothetical protein
MSENAKKDHEALRQLLQTAAAYLAERFPRTAANHRLVRLYSSFQDFVSAYPSSDERDKALETLRESHALVRLSLKPCSEPARPLFEDSSSRSCHFRSQATKRGIHH